MSYPFLIISSVSANVHREESVAPGTALIFSSLFLFNSGRAANIERIFSIISNHVECMNDCYDEILRLSYDEDITDEHALLTLQRIFGLLKFHSGQTMHIWRVILTNYKSVLFSPTAYSGAFWQLALSEGLVSPNYQFAERNDRTPLEYALCGVQWHKKTQRTTSNEEVDDDESDDESDDENVSCIIKGLILAGANIYHMDPKSVEHAKIWTQIQTPIEIAISCGVSREWKQALLECGLDPDEVYAEDERLCKQEIRLHGARRSGIDESALEPPSWEGIRCRRCQGKTCSHGFK